MLSSRFLDHPRSSAQLCMWVDISFPAFNLDFGPAAAAMQLLLLVCQAQTFWNDAFTLS